ncbi:medium chain dehydrogenase/reductase family protein [Herbidospora mongoliensis]|uniref:medium chain dehydrogenase/reductase family protein n=1 Tax=Herbidospora mongoliensis TaxID=688067 RepID=UPI0008303ADE|nr:medium chain dehydrogenase/reductase family protein [Herbidospora mongoliensis]
MNASPASARRVVLPGLVEPDGLIVEEGPLDAPGPGQILVAVEATGVSYAEQAMRRGRYFGQPKFPFVPGYDLVGTVLRAGPQVDGSLIGARVATLTKTGGWASHAVVEARDSVVVPAGLDPAEAETVVVNGVTAWQMLHRAARVRPGQTILVHGAGGGVGGILIQLARHAGVRVIGGASPRHHDALRAAGVEPVDYNDPNLADRVRELSPGGVDAVFDNIGGPMMRVSYGLLAPRGALVCYAIIAEVGGTGGLVVPFLKAISRVLLWNALPNGHRATFYDVWSGHRMRPARFREHLEEDLGQVFALLADGTLKATIAARFPLDEAAAALTLAESRTVNGKIILLP